MILTMELKTNSNSLLRCISLALSSEVTIIKVILQTIHQKLKRKPLTNRIHFFFQKHYSFFFVKF